MSRCTPTSSGSRSACGGFAPRCGIASSAAAIVYGLHGRAMSHDSVRRRNLALSPAAEGSLERPVRLAALHARTLDSVRRRAVLFRKLTELSADWYWEQDAEFRLTFMSKWLAEKTGLDASAYLGRRRWDQPALNLTESDWARHRALLERHEPFRDFEMQRPAPNDGSRWLSISGEPVFDADGRFRGYRGIGRDITEHKRAEQRLRLEHAVSRVLAESDSVSAVLQGVLRAICEAESWESGRYFTIAESGATMRLEEAWSNGTPEADRFI